MANIFDAHEHASNRCMRIFPPSIRSLRKVKRAKSCKRSLHRFAISYEAYIIIASIHALQIILAKHTHLQNLVACNKYCCEGCVLDLSPELCSGIMCTSIYGIDFLQPHFHLQSKALEWKMLSSVKYSQPHLFKMFVPRRIVLRRDLQIFVPRRIVLRRDLQIFVPR